MRAFALLAVLIATVAGVVGLLMAVALSQDQFFQILIQVVVRWYSRTGTISPEGVEIVRQAAKVLIWTSGMLAVGAAIFAVLLWRMFGSQAIEDARVGLLGQEQGPEESWWSPRRAMFFALVLLAIGAVLRVPRLFTSLFYDEIFTIQHFATLPLIQIPFAQVESNNHTLNSLLLHWVLPISSEEALLRLPIYLAGVGSLWLFFQLGQLLGGPLVGLFAMWLAVMSPYHLWYSALARGYVLGLFFTLLGLWMILRASQLPTRRCLVIFIATQVLASLAMPTLALVPALLAGFILLGSLQSCRAVVGVHPCSSTGMAWLLAALWAMTLIGIVNLPMMPFFILRLAREEGHLGGSFAEAADWLGVFQQGPLAVMVGLSIIGLGAATFLNRQWDVLPWNIRFLLVLWAISFILFVLKPIPARIHVVAFIGAATLAAVGLRSLLAALVFWMSPSYACRWAWGALSVVFLAGIALASWGAVVEAAQGTPLQDIRRAVKVAEAVLPDHGVIFTSGFAFREIAYYATRPIQLLSPDADPSRLLFTNEAFCYFRLYANSRGTDPIFDYFQALVPPGMVVAGQDPISIWCFLKGKPVQLK